ncbi:MAG: hypothetical protein PHI12_06695 [Dehalococcoidales bacterium]|nr:hypothetical protein [Candidatus Omnitrophota bacterium]MDD5510477.1 hypothetical protein [Dehalococcoidales bacterium]
MSPNVFSCSAEWFEKLKAEQPKVVVATWSEKAGAKNNKWLERLQELEKEGIPIFVCDGDSCKSILDKIGTQGAGETIVFGHGVEKGRLMPGENLEDDLGKVKEMTR